MNQALPRAEMEKLTNLIAETRRRRAKIRHCSRGYRDANGVWRGGLLSFVRYFWHVLEPGTKFVDGWALEAVCLPYQSRIITEDGVKPIGDIVEGRWRGNVLSVNHATGEQEWRLIAAHMKSPGQALLTIKAGDSTLELTANHPVFTKDRGYVRADEVKKGDAVFLRPMREGVCSAAERIVESGGTLPRLSLRAARSSHPEPRQGWSREAGFATVDSIERAEWVPDAVYNIEVEGNNNYFAEGVLVHNCEHLEAVTFGEITKLLINVPPGFMKGCADSTPILTPDGYRTHGDLRTGDRVFGPDGEATKIIARSKDLVADYDVELSTGEIIKCTNDHLWHVYDRWGKAWGGGGWKTVTTQWLATAKADKGRSRFFIPDTLPLQFPHRELALHPYYLGCWLGDGTSDAAVISHDRSDRAHIDRLMSLGYSVSAEWKNGGKGVRSSFGHQGIVGQLKRLGIFKNKRIPEEYLLSSERQRRELLAGLIDTDGTVDSKRSRVTYYTCDSLLAEDVQRLVLSLGMRPYVTTMDAPGYEEYSSDKTYFLIGFQPDAPIPTAIPRKRITRFDFTRRKRAILSVSKSEIPEIGHCIAVDRSDGLYVVGSTNVVTHNSLLTDVFWPAWEWGPMKMPHVRYVAFSYSSSLTERDNLKFHTLMSSPDYQAMYGDQVELRKIGEKKVSNSKHGWKLATSVGGVGTGERGDRVILDDPHNVKDSESKVVREETVRWFWESMSSRLNDMELGAKVVIMQRVSEGDVSGEIVAKGDWCHLLIPMEYVWRADSDGEPIPTDIGWVDPRWRDSPQDCDGALAWPERFPERIIPSMKADAGPFAWACNPYEAPILMADLSMRPIGTVVVGDKIIGFKTGSDSKRARYQEATILDIHKSIQPCVKITFDSGRTIRCTENHKWWTGRNDAAHQPYAPAILGSKLRRICPPFNSRVFTQRERVISIEPDATEVVYGLTTTTGNYVVWGLASSNSQYQQIPKSRGSTIFEEDFWEPWEPADGKFPLFSYVLASVDSAYGEDEANDPSAMVVVGIFENENGFNRAMLMTAWRRRLKFSGPQVVIQPGERGLAFQQRQRKSWGLIETVADTCTRFKVDRLLIEGKASGISAAQSLGNSHPRAGWAVQLVNPKGDKHARALAVQPSFSQGLIYVPFPLREWGEAVIDEMAYFPKGSHDDLTDAMTQAIKYLRDTGMLRNDSEVRGDQLEAVKAKPKRRALYPGVRKHVA